MSGLPKGWINTKFTEIFDVNGGTQPPKKDFIAEPREGYLRLLQIRDFGKKPVPTYIPDNGKRRTCTKEDVLIGRYGASIGRICTGMEGAYNVALAKVDRPNDIDKDYLKYYLKSDLFQFPLSLLSRSAQNGFNKTDLSNFDFFIAPHNEQIRIANKLDSILTKVDKAQARLDKIPAILKRFRQSVLAAATSGELTKEWRAENPSATSEPILNELSSFKFDARTKKLVDKEIRPDEISTDLPSGWKWVRLCGITDVVSGVAKGSKTKEKTVSLPYLRVANVQRGYLDLSEVKYIDVAQSKGENLKLEKGDVLFNEGGDIDKLGRGWVWEGQIEDCIHQNHVFRARILSNKIQPKYLSFYGNESARDYFLREGTQTVNLANLNKTTLSLLPVPLPPEEEQVEIVRQVDRLLNKANKVEKQYLDAKARLDRLTQSILGKAFRGELVPQDPTDEPAEKLLERIWAEKEQSKPKKTTRKCTTKAKAAEKE